MGRPTLNSNVYQQLRNRITSGDFPPGMPLREQRLASELGVSRTPLREALRQLAEQGFVKYNPRKGARVLQPTPELVQEVFDVREALEGIAAREAALKADSALLCSLREKFEKLRISIAQGDTSEIGDEIHDALFKACSNQRLIQLSSVIRDQVRWIQGLAVQIPGRLERAFQEHESILIALESRDPEWAESAVRAHIRITLRDLLASLECKSAAP